MPTEERRCNTFSTPHGDVVFAYPATLSPRSAELILMWLKIMQQNIEDFVEQETPDAD